jgi:hypothetical protein
MGAVLITCGILPLPAQQVKQFVGTSHGFFKNIILVCKIGSTDFHIPKNSFFKMEKSKIFDIEKAMVHW